ncbi:MAG: GDP-L-fucose synthase [Thermoleophilia bacterium]|nr:GDP-L-fucose synthase [Thermoleophilia bacterium]
MERESKIYVAGHRGLVGSALVRRLESSGYQNLVLRSRQELDLLDAANVRAFFVQERPDYVFLAAARVGGIAANVASPVEFLRDNLTIQNNVLSSAHDAGVTKLMFLGSSCIYPRECAQPMREDYLMTGPVEPTNEGYALAKIAGLKLAAAYRSQYGDDFVSVMPSNLYGPGDNFDPEKSHVVPGMIRRLHEAKLSGADHVELWGTGTPRRELLYVDDLADACVYLMNEWSSDEFVNIGTGEDVTIAELARSVADVVGYQGELRFDPSRPDGMPRKVVDIERLAKTGWSASTSLSTGLATTYRWFLENVVADEVATDLKAHA